MDEIELTGKVVVKTFSKGSKSEHDAVYLDTGKEKYRLRKKGGNPFYDASLHKLVGDVIKVKGRITPHFFIVTNEPEKLSVENLEEE